MDLVELRRCIGSNAKGLEVTDKAPTSMRIENRLNTFIFAVGEILALVERVR